MTRPWGRRAARPVATQRRTLTVNDDTVEVELAPGDRLLDVLRDGLGLLGTKEACGRGECGTCTVLVAGRPVLACLTLAWRVAGVVETVEGLAEETHELRRALADHGGVQCGFCTPGQVVRAAAAARERGPSSVDDAVSRHALAGNLCRCTGYDGIVAAIRAGSASAGSGP
jgi:aerobic-type carbon monoxide dehydrogenase small subunit (CoxS/CutS family)